MGYVLMTNIHLKSTLKLPMVLSLPAVWSAHQVLSLTLLTVSFWYYKITEILFSHITFLSLNFKISLPLNYISLYLETINLEKVTHNFVRRDLNSLTERDVQSLKAALRDLQLDTTNDGWASLASMHGAPARCKDDAGHDVACCIHGMPNFPHWHRLFTLQVILTLF